ncbi:MAG: glycoside hydrolase family 3 C-terminal domain-containing protein [Oscillospiraceae bacterium]|nr:glycoside hydrolase family 3 C-terminal domain-containing protein [Oscillospiraceae bacterium]
MNVDKILSEMTLEEKAAICSGKNFWQTKGFERPGIPMINLCDGPHGLRKQVGEADHLGLNESIKAICFPAGSAIASSFDEAVAWKVGETLGAECQAENVAVSLGPAVNIKRSPLCGRNFEYLSEDPYLAGKIGVAMVKGLQSQDVLPCVKHYAANNQETLRMTGDSVVDERTLHELYLSVFETIVKEAKPRSIMTAYNRINGSSCSENKELLTDILRDKWGFDGATVTDWGAVKDPVEGVRAGLDLVMPGGNDSYAKKIIAAVKDGTLPETDLDKSVRNVLNLIAYAVSHKKENAVFDRDADYRIAAELAKECAVLLKNDGGLLPLKKDAKAAFIGEFAEAPRYQGSGSSHVNSAKVVAAKDAAAGLSVTYARGYRSETDKTDDALLKEAVEAAKNADIAVLFVGLPDEFETEGADRETMDMPNKQNELIAAVAAVQQNTVVVLHNGSPVAMPWIDKVPAVLEMYLAGDGCGEATVALLYGDANPSGKLAETFPVRLADTPAYLNFPGERGIVEYREGVFVGYRYYDKKEIDVLFPFGHGLSYTAFTYSDIRLDKNEMDDTDTLTVTATVKNTGNRYGKEVVQLYVRDVESTPNRPIRELKAFAKVALDAGESKDVEFKLGKRAFAYYETRIHDFAVETGEFIIEVGASSRDIRLRAPVTVRSTTVIPVIFTRHSTVGDIAAHPKGQAFMASMQGQMKTPPSQGEENVMGSGTSKMIEKMRTEMPLSGLASFMGLTDEQLDGMVAMLNTEI